MSVYARRTTPSTTHTSEFAHHPRHILVKGLDRSIVSGSQPITGLGPLRVPLFLLHIMSICTRSPPLTTKPSLA